MAEENNQNWSRKKVLMVLIGAVVLRAVAAIQESTQQFVKDFFSPTTTSVATKPSPDQEKPSIQIGDHAQGIQIGNGNTQNIMQKLLTNTRSLISS